MQIVSSFLWCSTFTTISFSQRHLRCHFLSSTKDYCLTFSAFHASLIGECDLCKWWVICSKCNKMRAAGLGMEGYWPCVSNKNSGGGAYVNETATVSKFIVLIVWVHAGGAFSLVNLFPSHRRPTHSLERCTVPILSIVQTVQQRMTMLFRLYYSQDNANH